MSQIKFFKSRKVKTPTRGTSLSAGIDFYVPDYTDTFINDLIKKNSSSSLPLLVQVSDNEAYITILPNGRALIPSGIHSYMDANSALIGANKSGVATKSGLVFGAHVIDADYTGEIHISVINTSNVPVTVKSGEKLIQFIHTPVLLSDFELVDQNAFNELHGVTERGDGGFGSTGVQ